ncbi:MAG: CTP synthase [Lachnospiraceae bacterium]|nr:CTP synthase [Lachnospiraceae bacterium]MBR1844476.1 CTP synthase [Lachnospiraceae bacterium]
MVKYIFVTGGVVSGLGKGITASSLGRLLKARGYKVTMQKFDPYLNLDPGTMNPIQHGEVFVTDDGAETDLDLGHYERFIDESLTKNSTVTSGKIYSAVLNKERKGDYGGGTVQFIPHVTNEIKSRFYKSAESLRNRGKNKKDDKDVEIAIIEVGGTVGDIESQPFIETIRQFKHELGNDKVILVHVVLIPYIKASEELKTKPTQQSVKTLQGMGIQPDILVCRSEHPVDQNVISKISLFCNLDPSCVIINPDVDILYEVPIVMEKQGLAKAASKCLGLKDKKPNLAEWNKMIDNMKNPTKEINIALVGKYVALHDAYLSVVEALKAAGGAHRTKINIVWVDSETIKKSNVSKIFKGINGIIVPGGFGYRGVEGMILAAEYARVKKIPYLGICLGMQIAVIEFARNVLGLKDANSAEFVPDTKNPVIHLLPEQVGVEDIGGTLRLGSYPCILDKSTKIYKLFGKQEISERHRHRYEVNNDYREEYKKKGLMLAGLSPNGIIVEMIELKNHPYFVATQSHPELKSRPNRPHPLFDGFVAASIENKSSKKKSR